ncbi:MAG: AhpC/TSA family protein [Tannerella sp.]|jgi:peroxiredoxin|nr:AhpC/TSA family protein [Tannerella sp.]
MLKKLLLLSYICSLLFSCKEDIAYQVRMKLCNLDSQTVYAVFEGVDKKSIDTLFYEGNSELVIKQAEEDFRTLTIYFDNRTQWISVYLEPQKKISISGDFNDLFSIRIKGGKINDQLSDFRKKTASLLKEQSLLLASEKERKQTNDTGDHHSRLANINHQLRVEAEAFIKKHPDEEASAILIGKFFSDPDDPLPMDELLGSLNSKLDDFYLVGDLKSYVEKAKRTMVGAKVPAFHVKNIHDTSYTDESYKNRYYIIAFTALWCEMCHTEELLLDEVSSMYPEDSLGLLLVSLDEEVEDIHELIRNDSIKWNIVIDSSGQAIEMLDLFNVNVLPKCFLISPEGIIVLKTENGSELKQTLSGLFRNPD